MGDPWQRASQTSRITHPMIRNFQPRSAIVVIGACAALFIPSIVRADPVKDLENAIKVDINTKLDDYDTPEKRALVDKILPHLKTILELRTAYYLTDWTHYVDKAMYERRITIL